VEVILLLSLGFAFLGFEEGPEVPPLTDREQAQLRLKTDLRDRVDIYLRAIQQRLAQAEADLVAGRKEAAMTLLESYEKLACAAVQEIEQSPRKRKDKPRAGKKLEIALRKGRNRIGDLKPHFSVDEMDRLQQVESALEEVRKKLIVLIFDLEEGVRP